VLNTFVINYLFCLIIRIGNMSIGNLKVWRLNPQTTNVFIIFLFHLFAYILNRHRLESKNEDEDFIHYFKYYFGMYLIQSKDTGIQPIIFSKYLTMYLFIYFLPNMIVYTNV